MLHAPRTEIGFFNGPTIGKLSQGKECIAREKQETRARHAFVVLGLWFVEQIIALLGVMKAQPSIVGCGRFLASSMHRSMNHALSSA